MVVKHSNKKISPQFKNTIDQNPIHKAIVKNHIILI